VCHANEVPCKAKKTARRQAADMSACQVACHRSLAFQPAGMAVALRAIEVRDLAFKLPDLDGDTGHVGLRH